jgi:CubicO group peptidase (beta-lactamase class C family)
MRLQRIKILSTLLLSYIFLLASALPAYAGQTPSGIPFSEMESQIDAFVADHIGQTTPGVAVIVVKDGEAIFSKGYGYADIERGIPVDPETTVFEWGSTGKLLVWVNVMQLVERGLLDLDADINNYLPEDFVRQLNFEKSFTMRDILNHTTGFGEYMFDFMFDAQTIENPVTLREGLLMAQPLQIYEPGTVAAYSNFATGLAGYIVGHIGGEGFSAFEMENILIPSGMNNTLNAPDWLNNHTFLQEKAIGYIPDGRGGFQEGIWSYFPIYPAGSINGTAEDLARFAIALTPPQGESGPLFESADGLATLFSPSFLEQDNRPGTYHGFVRFVGASPSFGFGGDTAAFASSFVVVPEERFGVIVIANADTELNLRLGIPDLLLGNNFDQVQPATSDLPSAAAVEGSFINARSFAGGFLEFMDYVFMPMLEVTAADESTITLSWGAFGSTTYRQVEPYVFHMVSSDSYLGNLLIGSEIQFRMENGKPVQVLVSSVGDFLALSNVRSTPSLILSAAVAISSTLFFLLMPVILLIVYLRNRKKGINPSRFALISNGLLLCGTLLVINNLFSLVRIIINVSRTASEMAPHIWINYTFAGLSILLLIVSLMSLRGEKIHTSRKVIYIITLFFVASLIFALQDWNFFVLL